MLFSPEKTRNLAFRPELLDFLINRKYEVEAPIGNVGINQFNTIIKASLVDLFREVASILPRALSWIDEGIAKREEFLGSKDGHLSRLWAARALGTWLLNGSDCEDMWHQALLAARAGWITDDGGWTDGQIRDWGLDLALPYALLSGHAYKGAETAVELYERYTGKSKAPVLKTLRSPKGFAYALALRSLGRLDADDQTLLAAGRRMLAANLQDNWFGSGLFIDGAMWLKLVYSLHQPPLTPLQTILRAYDNMPDVPWPDFMPVELKD